MLLFEYIINFVAPHSCAGCGAEGAVLCNACIDALPTATPVCYVCGRPDVTPGKVCGVCIRVTALGNVFVATDYRGVSKKVVHKLKFERASALAPHIADRMAKMLPAGAYTVVTYVPTASSRVRARGYDQARLIAQGVAKRLGLPCIALISRNGQHRQVGQRRIARMQQMKRVFSITRPGITADQRVLLIDDVLTTGSTLESAALVLKAAGATHVDGAVFAQSIQGLDRT
jgi:ComF family protein